MHGKLHRQYIEQTQQRTYCSPSSLHTALAVVQTQYSTYTQAHCAGSTANTIQDLYIQHTVLAVVLTLTHIAYYAGSSTNTMQDLHTYIALCAGSSGNTIEDIHIQYTALAVASANTIQDLHT